VVGSAALLSVVVERAIARKRWQTAIIVGLIMFPLSIIAVYIAAIFVGGGHRCFD
jgi:hypothetical protein